MRHLLWRAVCVRPVSYCCGQLAVIKLILALAHAVAARHFSRGGEASKTVVKQSCSCHWTSLAATGCQLWTALPAVLDCSCAAALAAWPALCEAAAAV